MMAAKGFTVVQTKTVPKGSLEYEERRKALLGSFASKVPPEYCLSTEFTKNPPTDVTAIPATCGILTPREIDITENYDATGLAEAIATKKFTAVTVTTAFCKRAIIAHQLTCCLTQWFMSEAIEQAKSLDEYLENNGKTFGPLHGVPISIKDHIPIANTYSSTGSIGSVALDETDSHMVAILRKMGAVFYVKTNQPQSLMHLESDSHWGRVLNPYNIHLSAGGSTGGEAALISMKGSPMGVGADIGGSIRAPSAFCGIYGFKPTSYTLPMQDMLRDPFAAELNILVSTGPMCRSFRDMDLFMTTILAAKPHLVDPRIVPIPWTGLKTQLELAGRKLVVGIIDNDGFIEPQPPVKRAIAWARERLSDPRYANIVEIKPFKPYAAADGWRMIRRMYFPDGGAALLNLLTTTGEPLHPLTEWTLQSSVGLTADAASRMRRERDNFRAAAAESWTAQGVDITIGPCFVGPAAGHDTALYWTYTSLWNLLDCPGVAVPTPIRVESGGERYAEDYRPLSEDCAHVRELWERGDFAGAPVALQVVARKYHDNQLFGALVLLKDVLQLP
jgi:amidase